MTNKITKNPILLMILDGFGFRKEDYYNGVLNAHMPNYFKLWNNFPHTKINASGPLVGLPIGQIGSSEVGHMTIGAGRLIKQPIVRINEEIKNQNFQKNKILNNGLIHLEKNKSNLHIMGLLGHGGVHSSQEHLEGFLKFYDKNIDKITGKIFIHNFLDGRDVAQKSAEIYLKELENFISKLQNSEKFIISTICGRFYAMDRDKRWNRVEKAYNMLVNNSAEKYNNWQEAIKNNYENEITDEFVEPSIIEIEPISDNDLIVFYNFRTDRTKELTQTFVDENFSEFKTKKLKNTLFQTLTEYSPDFKAEILYPTIFPDNTLGEILSKNNLNQLRIAESEKFPHVTYFFNGLSYEKLIGEEKIKINSPKVETYDLAPEMSSVEVTKNVIEQLKLNKYDFILLNFANPDMVGHTGNYDAVLKALNKIDIHIEEIRKELEKQKGTLIITADHGNCEEMKDENNKPHTKHTYNIVPFILCDAKYELKQDTENLSLFNIASTILELLKIKKPKEYADSLIKNQNEK